MPAPGSASILIRVAPSGRLLSKVKRRLLVGPPSQSGEGLDHATLVASREGAFADNCSLEPDFPPEAFIEVRYIGHP